MLGLKLNHVSKRGCRTSVYRSILSYKLTKHDIARTACIFYWDNQLHTLHETRMSSYWRDFKSSQYIAAPEIVKWQPGMEISSKWLHTVYIGYVASRWWELSLISPSNTKKYLPIVCWRFATYATWMYDYAFINANFKVEGLRIGLFAVMKSTAPCDHRVWTHHYWKWRHMSNMEG